MQVRILILTVVIVAVFAICIYAYGRSSKGSVRVVDDGPRGWTWDGEMVHRSKGNWIPWK